MQTSKHIIRRQSDEFSATEYNQLMSTQVENQHIAATPVAFFYMLF